MDITYLGHSCFRIVGGDLSVVIDPYDPKIGMKLTSVTAQIVLVSHDHGDHNYIKGVQGYRKVIDGPGEYEIGGVSFIGIHTYHDGTKGAERGGNIVFVIEIDGFRICHLGDLGHKLSEKQISNIGEIDILMVPVGGFYTIDSGEALEVVRSIEPRIIIPMHYKTKDRPQSDKLEPVKTFVSAIGLTPEETNKISLKAGSLAPEEQRLVVMRRKKE